MAARRRSTKRQGPRSRAGGRARRRSGGWLKSAWAKKLRAGMARLGSGWSMATAGVLVGIVVVFVIGNGREPPRPVASVEAPVPAQPAGPVASPAPAPAPETAAAAPQVVPAPPSPAAGSAAPSPPVAAPSPPVAALAPQPTLAALPAPPPAVEGETPTWLRNAVATPDVAGRPVIAVVIDDLGLNRVNSARVSALPGPLTLAFLTYAGDLKRQAAAARRAGHELIVHMAMEPLGENVDPGPDVLRTAEPPGRLMAQLRHNLDAFDGYVGINNHMGSRFTAAEPEMRLVLAELKSRGLLFLDSRTTAESVGGTVAGQLGVPFAERDVFLDNVQSADAVEAKLAEVERIARNHGHAIAIGHPHDATIAALAAWLPTLERRGFALVPVSAIVKRKYGVTG